MQQLPITTPSANGGGLEHPVEGELHERVGFDGLGGHGDLGGRDDLDGPEARGFFICNDPDTLGAVSVGRAATPRCIHTPGGTLHQWSPIGY